MEVTWTTLLIVCPLVFLSGLVDAVAGGGGLISLPAYLLAGLPPHAATATNKCGSVFGTGLSTLRFLKNGRVRLGPAAVSAATALLGSVLGARLCLLVPDTFLHYFLVAALPVLAVFLLLKRDFGLENKADALSGPLLMLLSGLIGLVLGLYDGFFGPGAGTFVILAFTALCRFDLVTASGNAKVVNFCSNLAAFVTFALAGEIVWALGVPAAVCGLLGHYTGSGLALKKGAKAIRPMFFVVLGLLLCKTALELAG